MGRQVRGGWYGALSLVYVLLRERLATSGVELRP